MPNLPRTTVVSFTLDALAVFNILKSVNVAFRAVTAVLISLEVAPNSFKESAFSSIALEKSFDSPVTFVNSLAESSSSRAKCAILAVTPRATARAIKSGRATPKPTINGPMDAPAAPKDAEKPPMEPPAADVAPDTLGICLPILAKEEINCFLFSANILPPIGPTAFAKLFPIRLKPDIKSPLAMLFKPPSISSTVCFAS